VSASFTILEALHRQSSGHRQALSAADKVGCFYCRKTFKPTEILDWVDSGGTALCPRCGIDSVVPETAQHTLTAELLHDMHAYWFKRSVFVPSRPTPWQRLMLRIQPIKRRLTWFIRGKRAG
jgi:hypothetical protein